MPLRGDERYVVVHGVLKRRTAKAVLIETDLGEGWIARSCIHFATDKAVDDMDLGDAAEFRVMEWAANDKGLI